MVDQTSPKAVVTTITLGLTIIYMKTGMLFKVNECCGRYNLQSARPMSLKEGLECALTSETILCNNYYQLKQKSYFQIYQRFVCSYLIKSIVVVIEGVGIMLCKPF